MQLFFWSITTVKMLVKSHFKFTSDLTYSPWKQLFRINIYFLKTVTIIWIQNFKRFFIQKRQYFHNIPVRWYTINIKMLFYIRLSILIFKKTYFLWKNESFTLSIHLICQFIRVSLKYFKGRKPSLSSEFHRI